MTNSIDGTADALCGLLNEEGTPAFRWNVDLWQHYEIQSTQDRFQVVDPLGRKADLLSETCFLIWRKPFTAQMTFDPRQDGQINDDFARSEMQQALSGIAHWLRMSGRVRLVEPFADRRLPKLLQLRIAPNYFSVPQYDFSILGFSLTIPQPTIAKPLGNPSVGEQAIFYTTAVEPPVLGRPFPWFVQSMIPEGKDVTCVFIQGRCFFFKSEFARSSENLDWRIEINSSSQSKWSVLEHKLLEHWSTQVVAFMNEVGLKFGRLDFILKDEVLWFLECNSNGQFGWLDDPQSLYLHRYFLKAAENPHSRI